jgi:molybdenum cofactor guanylyltransferase
MSVVNCEEISGVILAGGLARRMGGIEKALVEFQGETLLSQVIKRIQPQVKILYLNVNKKLEQYQKFNLPILIDAMTGFLGPLAGILTALNKIETDFLLIVPCDAPFVSLNLAEKLFKEMQSQNALGAVVHDGERLQPTFLLLHKQLRNDLEIYLQSGQRSIEQWLERHFIVKVDFSTQPSDFINFNTFSELNLNATK